jgi:hypothetical protein
MKQYEFKTYTIDRVAVKVRQPSGKLTSKMLSVGIQIGDNWYNKLAPFGCAESRLQSGQAYSLSLYENDKGYKSFLLNTKGTKLVPIEETTKKVKKSK